MLLDRAVILPYFSLSAHHNGGREVVSDLLKSPSELSVGAFLGDSVIYLGHGLGGKIHEEYGCVSESELHQ